MQRKKYSVVLVDDHNLLRQALVNLINSYDNFKVLFDADNCKTFRQKLASSFLPDIILLDLNLPDENGMEIIPWVNRKYPKVKVVILSMCNDEHTIVKAFKAGAKGYLFKNIDNEDFRCSLDQIVNSDYFLHPLVHGKMFSDIHESFMTVDQRLILNQNELNLLNFLATEMSYREIACKMHVSPRTIEDYKEKLSIKLKVKSRTGMVVYAIKNSLIDVKNP